MSDLSDAAPWIAIGAAAAAVAALVLSLAFYVKLRAVRKAQLVLMGSGKDDLVNFAVIAQNLSLSRVASHVVFDAAQSAGFQVLGADLGDYGYFYDFARPRDLSSSAQPFSRHPVATPRTTPS